MPLRLDDLDSILQGFDALSDETRFRIVSMLAAGPMTVSDLAEELEISQPLTSFHLARLRSAGLVSPRRQGSYTSYSLNHRLVARLERALRRVLDSSP